MPIHMSHLDLFCVLPYDIFFENGHCSHPSSRSRIRKLSRLACALQASGAGWAVAVRWSLSSISSRQMPCTLLI